MTFLSAFAGIGGFDLALERAGMRCAGQVEIDPSCRGVLARHFPEVDRHDDIRTTFGWWTGQPRPDLDLLTAGFPCQDLSSANTSGRAGLAGQRSGLFFDLVRAVGALRPRWLLLENVTGLLYVNQGRDFQTVLEALGDLGYGLAWRVLDAACFGLAQRRRRVFVVGCRGDLCPPEVLFASGSGTAGAAPRGASADPPAPAQAARGAGAPDPDGRAAPGGGVSPRTMGVGPLWMIQPGGWTPLHWRESGPSYTLDTNARPIVAYAPPGQRELAVRRFTPVECERLQGFPDGWTATAAGGRVLSDGVRYRMLGNAVAVPVVEWIGHRLLGAAAAASREARAC